MIIHEIHRLALVATAAMAVYGGVCDAVCALAGRAVCCAGGAMLWFVVIIINA